MSFHMEHFAKDNYGPLHSLTAGILIFLMRSVTDPLWKAFVSRTHHFSKDAYVIKIVLRDLTKAKKMNLIHFDDLDAATDFYIGGIREAV